MMLEIGIPVAYKFLHFVSEANQGNLTLTLAGNQSKEVTNDKDEKNAND